MQEIMFTDFYIQNLTVGGKKYLTIPSIIWSKITIIPSFGGGAFFLCPLGSYYDNFHQKIPQTQARECLKY